MGGGPCEVEAFVDTSREPPPRLPGVIESETSVPHLPAIAGRLVDPVCLGVVAGPFGEPPLTIPSFGIPPPSLLSKGAGKLGI